MFIFLNKSHLEEVLSLQELVISNLVRTNLEHNIIKREAEYFEEHMEQPHCMIGFCNDEGKLLSHAIFHNPNDLDIRKEIGIDNSNNFINRGKITIIQNILVHPDMRGRGYMQNIMQKWILWAIDNGYDHAIARIAANHTTSIKRFFKNGFRLIDIVIDARDDIDVFVAHKQL